MCKYIIKSYESGFEVEQVKVSFKVIEDWVWPFQYNLEFLKQFYSSPDFDPETALFCFKDDEMVGFISARIGFQDGVIGPGVERGEQLGATLNLPRILPNNEEAEDLLIEKMIEVLKSKNVPFIQTRASTMHTNSIELVERWNFKEHTDFPFEYKFYYHYELKKGRVDVKTTNVLRFDPDRDIDDCSISVSNFFKSSDDEAKKDILEIDNSADLVSHLVIREGGKLEGYCYALPNSLNKDIVATFHLEASSENYLRQLLVQVINDCLEKGGKYLLIDVIGKLLEFENVLEELGFDKVATWGIYEKELI